MAQSLSYRKKECGESRYTKSMCSLKPSTCPIEQDSFTCRRHRLLPLACGAGRLLRWPPGGAGPTRLSEALAMSSSTNMIPTIPTPRLCSSIDKDCATLCILMAVWLPVTFVDC